MGTPFVKFLRDYFSRKRLNVWGKTLRRFLKTPRRFSISLRIKNIFKFDIPLHSLHRYHNWLIYNTSPCNDKQKCHVTDVTFITSDISDMRKTSTLHVGILIFNGLQHLCDECNRISKVNFFLIIAHYIRKIFTFEEIIFLLERCIVKKKTYICNVWLEKWLDI